LSWLHHPGFVPIRKEVVASLKGGDSHFKKVLPVVFLCGGKDSVPRDRLAAYLNKADPKRVLLFYAEHVWDTLADRDTASALQVEKHLAELSDLVLIVVESPGTFAELGAFALAAELRKKMLPLLDERHAEEESFIRSGPVRWIDQDSKYKPSIWCNHEIILNAANDLEDRLTALPARRSARVSRVNESPKHLLFALSDLAAIFGPCPRSHLHYYLSAVFENKTGIDTDVLISLAIAMRLIDDSAWLDGERLLIRRKGDGLLRTFQEDLYIRFPRLRAQVLSGMLRIKDAARALEAVGP
jgi:hypothetical protein